MEQAGVNSIQLIENKDVLIQYNADGSIVQIAAGGTVLNVTGEYHKNLTVRELPNGYFKYEIDFFSFDVEKIRRSIYGWLAVLNLNGGLKKFIPIALNFDGSNQINNVSAIYSTKLTNFEKTAKEIVAFNPAPIPWILETGFWNDVNFWVNSATWID